MNSTSSFGTRPEVISALGTGKTTGHVATLEIINRSEEGMILLPAAYFIPSSGKYQSYIVRIHEPIHMKSLERKAVMLHGYCTDIHLPPVPSGKSLTDFSRWVIISEFRPGEITGGFDFLLPGFVTRPLPPEWDFSELEQDIINAFPAGYTPPVILVNPLTGTPINGTIRIEDHPQSTAPFLLALLEEIERSAYNIQQGDRYPTPFSFDIQKEYEAIVQQTFWIAVAALEGKKYDKEAFSKNIIQQFDGQLASPDPEKITQGVDQFWAVFSATGIEAKVLERNSVGLSGVSINPFGHCDSIGFLLSILQGGKELFNNEYSLGERDNNIAITGLDIVGDIPLELSLSSFIVLGHCSAREGRGNVDPVPVQASLTVRYGDTLQAYSMNVLKDKQNEEAIQFELPFSGDVKKDIIKTQKIEFEIESDIPNCPTGYFKKNIHLIIFNKID